MERLPGGNVTGAVRRGGDVLRAAGPWTDTVHALLRHVRARGVLEVPEPRGRDADGREVLEFIEGEVPAYPLPAWVWDDRTIVAAASLLRRLHDATAGFDPPDAVWRLPAHEPHEVVCHNDFAPYNLVFRDRRLVGAIDFDTASPGPRAWDLAYLAYRLVPLTAPDDPEIPATPEAERDRRLGLLCATYGPRADAAAVLATVPERLEELRAFTLALAAERSGAPADALRGHADRYAADVRYLRDRAVSAAARART